MGKKSRLKRERRDADRKRDMRDVPHDFEFETTCQKLRSVFARYSADDVMVSLCVSDLWLPNISSHVKHTLAFSVLISMPAAKFMGSVAVQSYAEFKELIEQVYGILPGFPMLEDYAPEADWGEVKFRSNASILRIFYGGDVERISDFITAFHLVHGVVAQANRDMHLALLSQHHLLTNVEKASAGVVGDIETGHVETPVEIFWRVCRDAILSLSMRPELTAASRGLLVKLGELPAPKRGMDFGDAVMTGSALPCFLVEIDGRHYPLALRNAATTVIQHWAEKHDVASAQAIAGFVSARLRDVIKGPFKVVTRTKRQPFIFSAVILGVKPHLVIALDEAGLAQLPALEAGLKEALSSGDWALQPIGGQGAVQIHTGDGNLPTALEQLVVVAVLSRVSTVTGMLDIPPTKARVLPLSDFVTIFDSIEDLGELNRYWAFVDAHSSTVGGISGPADRFAAFRDSNALLADGAVTPTMIALDPHWGSTWRHRMLTKYWDNSPPSFPDVANTAWNVERDSDGIYKLLARRIPVLSQSVVLNNCVAHFMLIVNAQPIEPDDGRFLELLIQCLADSINQRRSILSELPLFKYRQITTTCRAKMDALVTQGDSDYSELPLFSGWQVTDSAATVTVDVTVQANLQRIQKRLVDATDASFEVEATTAWIDGLSAKLGVSSDQHVLNALRDTSGKRPRFTLKIMRRKIDVPDYANPHTSDPEHYKIARRDLAIVFKDIGAKEGSYELAAAKALIDPARDKFRALIHRKISLFRRMDLVRFCIEQLDALIAEYDHAKTRIQISLGHEVSYDRTKRLAEVHEQFIKHSRNYRYLLECCFSMPESGFSEVSVEAIVQLLASVDWLLVLYNASDVLHNGLDVAGLELDQFFVPHVYYTEIAGGSETAFVNEAADFKLGVGLNPDDEVRAIQQTHPKWKILDLAFNQDTGLSLDRFLAGLSVFYRWPSALGVEELHFAYVASPDKVRDVLAQSLEEMTSAEAETLMSLVSLNPKGVRRLIGKPMDESDVPLWEHNKRGDRYMLKPLIQDEQGNLTWGAASMERACRIWQQNFANGYMPADFDFPNVKNAVRDIKAHLEQQLERATSAILARATSYCEGGIDFMRRFPMQGFDDVGDYDGLAYWPALNQWVIVECKYHQPAFCLKDGRRLRDRIFGTPSNKGDFAMIERRRAFFLAQMERIREILDWPIPKAGLNPIVHELYVTRDIYWWMRNPPYPVPSHFLRIDSVDGWLRSNRLML